MNYSGKINLLKFRKACIVSIKGSESVKKGVFIPIEDNNLYISVDDGLRAKGAYVDFTAWERQEVSRYGDTHGIRQSLSRDMRAGMAEDELKAIPYIGNMKPFELQAQNQANNVSATNVEVPEDDLPF